MFVHDQPLHASKPEDVPQSPSTTADAIGKPAPPGGLPLQSNTCTTQSSSREKSASPSAKVRGNTLGDHPTSSQVNAPRHILEQTTPGEPIKQSTQHSSHSERVLRDKHDVHVHVQQHRPVSFPQEVPASNISATTETADQLSQRPLHDRQSHQILDSDPSHPSNLPHHVSSKVASLTKGSPQPMPCQQLSSQSKAQQLSPALIQSGPPGNDDTNTSTDSENDILPEDDEHSNQLQRGVDDDIHKQAAAVMKQVSGSRHQVKTNVWRPYDPNLICPMCMKKFRIGEIQKFKRHVNICDGTDENSGIVAYADDAVSDLV